jgi:hypothetical protein
MEIEFLEDGSWRPLKAKGSEPPSRSRSPVLDTSVQTIEGEFLSCFLLTLFGDGCICCNDEWEGFRLGVSG